MKAVSLLSLLLLFSCAGRKIQLKSNDYEISEHARLRVNFLKDEGNNMDVSVSGLSTKPDQAVAIKKEEIGCGKGKEKGFVRKLQKIKEPYIVLNQTSKEFIVICDNPNFSDISGNFYLTFKNIYTYTEGMPDKVLASDIKVEFQ